MSAPLFEHDCDGCVFLGSMHRAGRARVDLYVCNFDKTPDGKQRWPTVIARFGNDGPDYSSGMPFVGQVPELTEAFARAVERGVITEDMGGVRDAFDKLASHVTEAAP